MAWYLVKHGDDFTFPYSYPDLTLLRKMVYIFQDKEPTTQTNKIRCHVYYVFISVDISCIRRVVKE